MTRDDYVQLVADLLNQSPDLLERQDRVREANRRLYKEVVSPKGSNTEADLALAAAAVQDQKHGRKTTAG